METPGFGMETEVRRIERLSTIKFNSSHPQACLVNPTR